MAITLDATSSQHSSIGWSWSHTTGSGSQRILLVAVCSYMNQANQITGITYDGVSLTKLFDFNNTSVPGASYKQVQLWYLVNPNYGTHDVVVAHDSDYANYFAVASFTGVNQSSPFRSVGNSIGNYAGGSFSGSISDCQVDDLALAILAIKVGDPYPWTSITDDAGQTRIVTISPAITNADEGIVSTKVATSPSTLFTWTFSNFGYMQLSGVSMVPYSGTEGDASFDTPFPTFAGRPGAVSSFNSLFPTATSGNRSGAVLNATMPMFYTNKYEKVTGKLEVNMPFFSVSATGLYQPSGNLEVDMPMFTVTSSGTLLEPGYANFETPTFTLSAQSGWHGDIELEVPFVTFAGSTGVGISFEVPFVKFNAEISEENTADLSVIMSMFDVSGIGLNGRIATASFNMMFPSLSTTGWFMAAGVLEAEMPFMLLDVIGHSSRFSGYEMRYVR